MDQEYIEAYLAAEAELRQQNGELTYFSKPVIYETQGGFVAVTPWAEYTGNPLILPIPEQVAYMAITVVSLAHEAQTFVRSLADVVNYLKSKYPVHNKDLPVPHIIVDLPLDCDTDELHQQVSKLPELT